MRSTRPQQSRSVCSGNPVLCARKYGFIGCFGRSEQLLVATSSALPKGAFQNDICWFESCMPSHAVRSLLCDFRVGENRRHSRGLGGRAAVSGQQIPKFPVWTSGFVAPVSAHHFPISVSARPRPVRYLTETGLQSCVSSVAVTRDVGRKSAASRYSYCANPLRGREVRRCCGQIGPPQRRRMNISGAWRLSQPARSSSGVTLSD